ncbi:MAG TPA: glycosyltransferase [Thermoanaerobaculia bacterium]|nr:glycosyltransferase [Thermoanaerobaculia bacterium]
MSVANLHARAASPKVALVHDWLTGMRGGEKVLEAIAELYPQAPIYTLFHFAGTVSPALESHTIHTSFLQRAPALRRHYRRYLPLFPTGIESFDLDGYDLVLSSSHCVAKGVIPGPHAYHVCYCHTPMRYAWDQRHAYFPPGRGPISLARALVLAWLRTWDAGTAVRVDRFVANSRFVAARIRRYYGRDADVLAPPVDVDFFTPGTDAADDDPSRRSYALAVAAAVPYKRLDLAVAACAKQGIPLRIVGGGPEERRLATGAGDVKVLGRVGDEELRELYRGARFLVQPGVEDFGISAVEALACGTPVVALGSGGVRDIVVHGEHGVLYHPAGDAGALAAAIDKFERIRFNLLNLRRRAEGFAPARFVAGLQKLLAAPAAVAEGIR